MFRSLGGFDDRLVYVEDVDLRVRITRQGAKLFLTDQTVVAHLGGGSFSLIAPTVPRLYRESQRLLARIHLRPCEQAVFLAGLKTESFVRRLTWAGQRVLG